MMVARKINTSKSESNMVFFFTAVIIKKNTSAFIL